MVAEPIPFQYVVVRVVPRVERGEQFNAGVVLFCPKADFLAARVELDPVRLAALAPGTDPADVRRHLDAVAAVAVGDAGAGPVARLDRSARFHWLASPSSTIIQPSPIHTGLCGDPRAALDRLFSELVSVVRPVCTGPGCTTVERGAISQRKRRPASSPAA